MLRGFSSILILLASAITIIGISGFIYFRLNRYDSVPNQPQLIETSGSKIITTPNSEENYLPGEIIVGIKQGVKVKKVVELMSSYNLKYKLDKKFDSKSKTEIPYDLEDVISEYPFFLVVYVPKGEEKNWIDTLQSNSIVEYAQPNRYTSVQ